jgi:phospholipase C
MERRMGATALGAARSRDNLPNPFAVEDDPYVRVNGPAISDLFVMFEFQHDHDHRNHD